MHPPPWGNVETSCGIHVMDTSLQLLVQQGDVTQALAVGQSTTAVKLQVNGQSHKIALTVGQDDTEGSKPTIENYT